MLQYCMTHWFDPLITWFWETCIRWLLARLGKHVNTIFNLNVRRLFDFSKTRCIENVVDYSMDGHLMWKSLKCQNNENSPQGHVLDHIFFNYSPFLRPKHYVFFENTNLLYWYNAWQTWSEAEFTFVSLAISNVYAYFRSWHISLKSMSIENKMYFTKIYTNVISWVRI